MAHHAGKAWRQGGTRDTSVHVAGDNPVPIFWSTGPAGTAIVDTRSHRRIITRSFHVACPIELHGEGWSAWDRGAPLGPRAQTRRVGGSPPAVLSAATFETRVIGDLVQLHPLTTWPCGRSSGRYALDCADHRSSPRRFPLVMQRVHTVPSVLMAVRPATMVGACRDAGAASGVNRGEPSPDPRSYAHHQASTDTPVVRVVRHNGRERMPHTSRGVIR